MHLCKGNKNSLEGLFTHFSFTTSKLQEILGKVKKPIQTTSPDYDIVIKRIHLYYDMKLVTFGTDKDNNLIIWFPVFV